MEAADPDGQGGPHAFVDDIDQPALRDDDRHHLTRVLRCRDGQPLTVADGRGRWRPCRMGDQLEPTGDVVTVPRAEPQLGVGVALVKGSRPELVVQKLTEVGIDHIALFAAERSVVRWDADKEAAQAERLTRVAREAGMQCRRSWLPRLEVLARLTELATRPGVALAERDGEPMGDEHRFVLVGPEGGWTDDERALTPARVRLGRHVLRAETAALAAGVLLTAGPNRA